MLFKVAFELVEAAFEVVFFSDELGDGAAGEFFDFVGLVAGNEPELDVVFDFFHGVSGGEKVKSEKGKEDDGESGLEAF